MEALNRLAEVYAHRQSGVQLGIRLHPNIALPDATIGPRFDRDVFNSQGLTLNSKYDA